MSANYNLFKKLWKIFFWMLSLGLFAFLLLSITFWHYGRYLPSGNHLANFQPFEATRLYDNTHNVVQEYANQKRVFISIKEIPQPLIQAFLVAEDKNFYSHHGLDIISTLLAALKNTLLRTWKNKPTGASTITQQLAKNLTVGNEKSLERKIKEAIMAFRLEYSLSKERIMELYLNQIYLGMGNYGVVMAAKSYFGKTLPELTLAEIAYIASLPKAPSSLQMNYHKAISRRNWVLRRLFEEEIITHQQFLTLRKNKLIFAKNYNLNNIKYQYFTETVRRKLIHDYGRDAVYQNGYHVYTTLDPFLQKITCKVMMEALLDFDQKQGIWRGPITKISNIKDKNKWIAKLKTIETIADVPEFKPAIILYNARDIRIGLQDGQIALLKDTNKWHNLHLKLGEVVWVRQKNNNYNLTQIPQITGGIVVMEANTGYVLAVAGGFSTQISQFNCAIQAMRQPGSSLKPFVFLSALENGYTPDSIVNDSYISIRVGNDIYTPKNMSGQTYGLTPLRKGLAHSRNLLTVRLAMQVGLSKVIKTIQRFGVYQKLPLRPSIILGSEETTVLKLANAYAMIINGGYKVIPKFYHTITDRQGNNIFQVDYDMYFSNSLQQKLEIKDNRKKVATEQSISHLKQMLREVINYGTGKKLLYLTHKYNIDLMGKTGTTNCCNDAWFIGGINNIKKTTWQGKQLVVGIFIGHKNPKSLGERESGATIAVPVFENIVNKIFMDHL